MNKKLPCLLLLFLICISANAQNLVPNGDFELHTFCPSVQGQIDSCVFWSNPANMGGGGSPDYLNSCATNVAFSTPGNYFGNQIPHSGDAYSGIVGWRSGQLWREYVEVQLSAELGAGECYHFEMYFSLADECTFTTDNLGVYFSDTLLTGFNTLGPLPFIPQIDLSLGLPTGTSNWIQISSNYTALGGEQYLTIGNFRDDSQTTSLYLNTSGALDYSYFYIDDVSLTVCTGMEDAQKDQLITLYPSPFSEYLNASTTSDKTFEIILSDITGRLELRKTITGNTSLNTSHLAKGIYGYEIMSLGKVIKKGIVVKE